MKKKDLEELYVSLLDSYAELVLENRLLAIQVKDMDTRLKHIEMSYFVVPPKSNDPYNPSTITCTNNEVVYMDSTTGKISINSGYENKNFYTGC